MAGNQVVLTFAGDTADLEGAFSRVGSGARDMAGNADRAGERLDRLGETGGTTETRFLGLGAGISGVSTLMSGDAGPEDYAMAMADLGDAVEHTVAPLLAQGRQLLATGRAAVVSGAQHVAAAARTAAAWVLMGIQATINAAKMAVAWLVSLGPIGLVILAVGAVIGILVALGVGFDDIKKVAEAVWNFILGAIQGVWNWVSENWPLLLAILTGPFGLAVLAITRNWDTIKAGATAVKDWISGRVGDIVGFFTGMPGRITSAFSSLGHGVADAFKSAWNSTLGGLVIFPGFNPPGPGSLPRIAIPELAEGGIVTRPTLALIGEAGPEAVVPLGRGMGGPTIVVNVYGSIHSDKSLVRIIRDELGRGGFGGVR